jgi:hypothetical protein
MDMAQMAVEALGMGAMPPSGHPPSLTGLPDPLKAVVIGEVLKTSPRRSTDLWYEDGYGRLFVLRGGIQWELNATGAFVWKELEEGAQSVLDSLIAEHPDDDEDEIKTAVVEFLLQADYFGLLELYPPSLEEDDA